MDLPPIRSASPLPLERRAPEAEHRAQTAARDFEAAFLAEMLKQSGLNSMPDGFGGGAGEEAFASFLTAEYARLLAERGGIGLQGRIFETIMQGEAKE